MKDLKQYIEESLLGGYDEIEKDSMISLDGLLSDDKNLQDETIALMKQTIIKSGGQRMKRASKIEWAETERWFVQFPKYPGYTFDIIFFHRMGSNFEIFYLDKIQNKRVLVRRIESWSGSTGLRYLISPRENEIYEMPEKLCDECKLITSKVTHNY